MAAVNFYRFASAIMELLEPKSETKDFESNTNSVSNIDSANSKFAEEAKGLAQQAEAATIYAPQSTEAETRTVEAVAANLTQVLANASDEKLAQVADVIKQVAVDTVPSTVLHSTALTETIEQAKIVTSADEVAQVVQNTVNVLASQAVEELTGSKTSEIISAEIQTNAVVTNVLTEKIQQKTAETIDSIDGNKVQTVEPNKVEPDDFWLKYDEIDPSTIKYYGTVSYLYDYMTNNSMLDYLDPNIDLADRYQTMSRVVGLANQKYSGEANLEQSAQNDNYSQFDSMKESEQELRQGNARKQQQIQLQQKMELQKLAERIETERLKQSI